MRPKPPDGFIEPCLPSPADKPPSGANWVHEIKHDGFRIMVRRDPAGVRLFTQKADDWTTRFPLIVEAVNHLKVRSCLIDGEAVCCNEKGLTIFQVLRRRQNEESAFLYAFGASSAAGGGGGLGIIGSSLFGFADLPACSKSNLETSVRSSAIRLCR
jgi:ATP-dependent DNA ligase